MSKVKLTDYVCGIFLQKKGIHDFLLDTREP